MGKYHVMVCGTTPCMLQGAREIYQTLKQHLGVDYGQTTEVGSPDLLSDCCTWFFINICRLQCAHIQTHSDDQPGMQHV